jgi:hypothetical protein
MDHATQWDPRSLFDLLESCGRNLRTLSRALERFSKLDLCRYYVAYDNYAGEVNPQNWEEFPNLTCEVSEDYLEEFAEWVVSQGAEFYHEVAAHPERIQQYLEMFIACDSGRGYAELRWDNNVDRDEYRGYQSAQGVAMAIYCSRYGGNILDACCDDRGHPREGLE